MDWSKVGQRIAELRKRYNVNQDEICKQLRISRPILSEIENGQRSPTVEQLIKLGELLGSRPYTYFLEVPTDSSPKINLQPLYRLAAAPVKRQTIEQNAVKLGETVEEFEKRVRFFLSVLEMSGAKLSQEWHEIRDACRNAGKKYPSGEDNRNLHARQLASNLRFRLGYGEKAPAFDLQTRLEEIGIVTFLLDRDGQFHGAAYVYDAPDPSQKYAFIAVGISRIPRMRFTLAHELAHILNHKTDAHLDRTLSDKTNLRETFANAFAGEFLMPESGIREWWQNTSDAKDTFDRALRLAAHFGVTVDAVVVRLQALGLVEQGTRDKLKIHRKEQRQDSARTTRAEFQRREEYRRELPLLYEAMCSELFRREEITQGKLAELLFCSHIEAVERAQGILDQYAADENGRTERHKGE